VERDRSSADNGKTFFATFYQETDPPSAVLTNGDDQVIAFIEPSGSGAKYTAANVEFWEHHGEATVTWFGAEMRCKALKAPGGGGSTMERQPLGGTSWVLRGTGNWKSNVSLALGPVALTRAMCPPSPLENRFARDLGYVRTYVMERGHLFLALMAAGGIYEFAPEKPAR